MARLPADFREMNSRSLPEKGEAENQPYVIFDVFSLLSLLLLFVCLLFYFVFFFLRWAQSRHKELKVRGSSLEFRLHKLKFLDLLREGHHREALQYSKHFARFASDHTKGGINCMVTLQF